MSKLFFHFSVEGFSNTYLLGPENGGEAIIFDPGAFDVNMLNLIEKNKFYIKHIFITHAHGSHIRGLKTLLKVYDANVYSAVGRILDYDCIVLSHEQTVRAGGYDIRAIEVQGHSSDSLVFSCENMLFTGDVLSAGNIGKTENEYLHHHLLDEIKKKLFVFEDNFFIFPGHGPPTTLEAEKKFNLSLGERSS